MCYGGVASAFSSPGIMMQYSAWHTTLCPISWPPVPSVTLACGHLNRRVYRSTRLVIKKGSGVKWDRQSKEIFDLTSDGLYWQMSGRIEEISHGISNLMSHEVH